MNGSRLSNTVAAKPSVVGDSPGKVDEVDIAFAESQPGAKRGRKAGTVALSIHDRLQQKRAELEQAKAEERELARVAAERIVSIVGRALLGQAQRDAGFKVSLVALLRQSRLTPADRREVAHLFIDGSEA
jgi:hypothetical protein